MAKRMYLVSQYGHIELSEVILTDNAPEHWGFRSRKVRLSLRNIQLLLEGFPGFAENS